MSHALNGEVVSKVKKQGGRAVDVGKGGQENKQAQVIQEESSFDYNEPSIKDIKPVEILDDSHMKEEDQIKPERKISDPQPVVQQLRTLAEVPILRNVKKSSQQPMRLFFRGNLNGNSDSNIKLQDSPSQEQTRLSPVGVQKRVMSPDDLQIKGFDRIIRLRQSRSQSLGKTRSQEKERNFIMKSVRKIRAGNITPNSEVQTQTHNPTPTDTHPNQPDSPTYKPPPPASAGREGDELVDGGDEFKSESKNKGDECFIFDMSSGINGINAEFSSVVQHGDPPVGSANPQCPEGVGNQSPETNSDFARMFNSNGSLLLRSSQKNLQQLFRKSQVLLQSPDLNKNEILKLESFKLLKDKTNPPSNAKTLMFNKSPSQQRYSSETRLSPIKLRKQQQPLNPIPSLSASKSSGTLREPEPSAAKGPMILGHVYGKGRDMKQACQVKLVNYDTKPIERKNSFKDFIGHSDPEMVVDGQRQNVGHMRQNEQSPEFDSLAKINLRPSRLQEKQLRFRSPQNMIPPANIELKKPRSIPRMSSNPSFMASNLVTQSQMPDISKPHGQILQSLKSKKRLTKQSSKLGSFRNQVPSNPGRGSYIDGVRQRNQLGNQNHIRQNQTFGVKRKSSRMDQYKVELPKIPSYSRNFQNQTRHLKTFDQTSNFEQPKFTIKAETVLQPSPTHGVYLNQHQIEEEDSSMVIPKNTTNKIFCCFRTRTKPIQK